MDARLWSLVYLGEQVHANLIRFIVGLKLDISVFGLK